MAGGASNEANGAYSFAAGRRAKAEHEGAFVWADGSDEDFSSSSADQFLIRAAGGVGIGTKFPQGALHVEHAEDGTDLVLGGRREDEIGMLTSDPFLSSSDLYFKSNDAIVMQLDDDGDGEDAEFMIWDKDDEVLFEVDDSGEVRVLGTVVHSSDRNRKERIEAIDSGKILEEIGRLPLYRWSYKGDAVRHVGPMAQDFHAAFRLGRDEKTIAAVDADGIALAAIQALLVQVQEQQRLIQSLMTRIEDLER